MFRSISDSRLDSLELIRPLLPLTVAFDPDAHASEYHLFSASEIDAQLHYISVTNGIESGRHVRLTKPGAIQKGA